MFDSLAQKFSSIFSYISGNNKLSQSNIQETVQKIEHALLDADVPYDVVKTFIQELSQEVIGQKVLHTLKPAEFFTKIVYEKVTTFLGGQDQESFAFKTPACVLMCGLQGSGKTTTIAKLATWAKNQNKKISIVVGSVDYYRPAAIDQLEILAHQVGVEFYRSAHTDVIKAAQDIAAYANTKKADLLFLDTAGRLHVEQHLLQELKQIDALVKPAYKILVLDAMTGQESLQVAKTFNDTIGIDYAILSKMDSQTRAGAAFAFRYALKKPILFIGTGEKREDLELFKAERIASRMIGMGDMQTLMEKVDQKIKKHDQESMQQAMLNGKFTLQDFASQLEMMGKIGSLSSLMRYIPGVGGAISPEMIQKGEQELKRFKAIISSMTPAERLNHKLLNSSRKQRISKGAGVGVKDIDVFLSRFEKSQEFVKLFKKSGRMPFV